MTYQIESRPVATGGLDEAFSRAAENSSFDIRPSLAAQAAISDLHRDFVAECLRVAAIKAAHGADNILLHDDLNAERDIRIAVENIREASRTFREWLANGEATADASYAEATVP